MMAEIHKFEDLARAHKEKERSLLLQKIREEENARFIREEIFKCHDHPDSNFQNDIYMLARVKGAYKRGKEVFVFIEQVPYRKFDIMPLFGDEQYILENLFTSYTPHEDNFRQTSQKK